MSRADLARRPAIAANRDRNAKAAARAAEHIRLLRAFVASRDAARAG